MYIAEIGINHKGDEIRAFEILKSLVDTEIDAITFQIPVRSFYEEEPEWGGPLGENFYKTAIDFVHTNNKLIGFAIVDVELVGFFYKNGADFWKTLSVSISDKKLLSKLQATNKLNYISTGLSDETEIINSTKNLDNIKLIHTQFHPLIEDANLKMISRLKEITGREIAYGLHCHDSDVLHLALAYSPSDIFFYVKDKPDEKYPDDEHAIPIKKIGTLIEKLNNLKLSIGQLKK